MGEEAARVVIPIVDMQESPFPYAKLREALEKLGCFRVLNHNVPTSLMSEMKTLTRYLHDFPIELKKRITCGESIAKGYTASDALDSLAVTPRTIDTFSSNFDLSSEQKATIEAYCGATGELINNLSNKMATSLGVSCENKDLFKDWFRLTRMIKYNNNDTPEPVSSIRLGSHTDRGFMTLLQDDEVVRGLEVFDSAAGSYISIEPSPGNLLVFTGDMAAAWSNGKLTNAIHRVQSYETSSVRVSIASFLAGPLYDALEAPEELLSSSGSPRLYKPIYYKEYVDLRFSNRAAYAKGEGLALYRVEESSEKVMSN